MRESLILLIATLVVQNVFAQNKIDVTIKYATHFGVTGLSKENLKNANLKVWEECQKINLTAKDKEAYIRKLLEGLTANSKTYDISSQGTWLAEGDFKFSLREAAESSPIKNFTRHNNYYLPKQGQRYFVSKDRNLTYFKSTKAISFEDGILLGIDSVYAEDLKAGKIILETAKREFSFTDTRGFVFVEEWNVTDSKFSKNVLAVGIDRVVFDDNGNVRGLKDVFSVRTNVASAKKILAKNVIYNVRTVNFMDAKQNAWNHLSNANYYQHMYPFQRNEIIRLMLKAVRDGKAEIVVLGADNDISKAKLLSIKDFQNTVCAVDTVWSEDLERGELIAQVVTSTINSDNVCGFSFIEDWFSEDNKIGIRKEIKGVGLLIETYTDSGDIQAIAPLSNIYFRYK